jgi:cystathionine beta-lyase/cystathionine gamma-synthase
MSQNTTSGTWSKGDDCDSYSLSTKLIHAGQKPCPLTGAVLCPTYSCTTFVQESIEDYQRRGYSYSRTTNPTVLALERKISIVENGFGAVCFGTGMAAINSLFCGYLKKGDHCVITNCSYGGTNRCARELYSTFGIEFTFVDFSDPSKVSKAMKENTRMVFSESPCNPTVTLADIKAISDIAHKGGAIHCCDSTFATPVICRPLDLGADITVQSTTKYFDGHNITVGGALICKTKEMYDRCFFMRNVNGNIMAPQIAFTQLQTMKTMELRVTKQSESAMKIAKFLESNSLVEKVVYPGLESFPQKELADRQHMNGLHGGMLWFEVRGGSENGRKLMNTVRRPWTLAENLGACESIITCPSVMTHANMLREDRMRVGITDGFVRISCGIENVEELIDALREALDALLN